MNHAGTALLATCLVAVGVGTAAASEARSVILLIGDGMGLSQRTLAYYALGHQPAMNAMPVVGLMSTEPAPSKSDMIDVTDSAAAGTAMACGVKTYNEAIGVDLKRRPVTSILEAAKAAGKATGLVVTSQVVHATPAAFAAHEESRDSYDAIAVDYLTSQPDVILGGGTDYFFPEGGGGERKDGRKLAEEFIDLGYTVVRSKEQLASIQGGRVLGLFAGKALTPVLDRNLPPDDAPSGSEPVIPADRQPTLLEMTRKALEVLSQDREGFFLMVEGSQIDWGGHANDAPYLIHETLAFDEAVAAARDFAAKDGNTLVIVLADHETGGLALGRGYEFSVQKLLAMKATFGRIAGELEANPNDLDAPFRAYANLDSLSGDDRATLSATKKLSEGVAKILNPRLGLIWASRDHSATLIPVTADGVGANLFGGTYDNTHIPGKIARALGIEFP